MEHSRDFVKQHNKEEYTESVFDKDKKCLQEQLDLIKKKAQIEMQMKDFWIR